MDYKHILGHTIKGIKLGGMKRKVYVRGTNEIIAKGDIQVYLGDNVSRHSLTNDDIKKLVKESCIRSEALVVGEETIEHKNRLYYKIL